MMDGLATAILQRTKVPINFSGALGEFRAEFLGPGLAWVLLGTQRIPSSAHKSANTGRCSTLIWKTKAGLQCEQGHERQLGMTSPDLSRYPLWMMQCLSTAIIQHLQLNSESLPLGGYFVPASKPVFSNPTGRPAPLGPDPINSPEVHGDSSNLLRGGSPMTPCRDTSQLRLFARAAPTRAPLGPFGCTIWGADTRPAIIIYWQSRSPELGLSAVELAVELGGPYHCPRHSAIRGSWHYQRRPLLSVVCCSLEWPPPGDWRSELIACNLPGSDTKWWTPMVLLGTPRKSQGGFHKSLNTGRCSTSIWKTRAVSSVNKGHERQPGMTSSDLSRYPLVMMQT